MNQDTDREMDFLLRRHGRPGATGLSGAKDASREVAAWGATSPSEHLDADEISAYAEGMLSERSRSRYASHLADCDQCRKIVTSLVLASNAEVEESPAAQPIVAESGRSWREWIASLFSPPVLRYAAPALALVAFASIVLVVMTRNRNGELSVARNEQPQQQSQSPASGGEAQKGGADTTTGTAPAATESPSLPLAANANSTENRPGAASSPSRGLNEKQDAAAPPPVQMDGVTSAEPVKTADDSRSQQQPAPQARPAEAKDAPQPSQSNEKATDKLSDRAKERDDATLAAKKSREEAAGTGGGGPASTRVSPGSTASSGGALGASSDASSASKRKNEAARSSAPATPSGRRARQEASGADEEGRGAATRTVAGKTFRQQNGVWVDTAYNSSRSTTRVRRGSEQYRSLAADEPVIASVANAFSGPCIVVVRNRAYYIY